MNSVENINKAQGALLNLAKSIAGRVGGSDEAGRILEFQYEDEELNETWSEATEAFYDAFDEYSMGFYDPSPEEIDQVAQRFSEAYELVEKAVDIAIDTAEVDGVSQSLVLDAVDEEDLADELFEDTEFVNEEFIRREYGTRGNEENVSRFGDYKAEEIIRDNYQDWISESAEIVVNNLNADAADADIEEDYEDMFPSKNH